MPRWSGDNRLNRSKQEAMELFAGLHCRFPEETRKAVVLPNNAAGFWYGAPQSVRNSLRLRDIVRFKVSQDWAGSVTG